MFVGITISIICFDGHALPWWALAILLVGEWQGCVRMLPDPIPPRSFTGNCEIREHTGDGHYVGRCDFATYDGVCSRHGVTADYPNNDDREVAVRDRRFAE